MSNFLEKLMKEISQTQTGDLKPKLKLLFRPDRWKYVRGKEKELECVFCKAARLPLSFETLVVYKSHACSILLNKFPYNSGHLLVIPNRHEGDMLKLTSLEYEDLHQTLRIAIECLQEVYEPHGMNVGLNLNKAAGAGLPEHLHYHVIPRFHGDLNFFPLIADTKVIPESLEECYKKIRNYFVAKEKS